MNDARTDKQRDDSSSRLDELIRRALLLDLETDCQGNAIHKIGALRQGREFRRQGRFDLAKALEELDAFAGDSEFLIGHNLLGHDVPLLRALAPALAILDRRIVDTLFISPLSFPANPYHHLIKNYKTVRDSISDPVEDCRLAERVLREQVATFSTCPEQDADLLCVYRFCFQGATLLDGVATGGDGISEVFRLLPAPLPSVAELRTILLDRWARIVCISAAPRLILDHLTDPTLRPVLAYATAWLSVAGANSVLPPWVRKRFPATVPLLKALRDRPCDDPDCAWCGDVHNPDKQLRHWFGFDAFRPEPASADGGSLQRAIVRDSQARRDRRDRRLLQHRTQSGTGPI